MNIGIHVKSLLFDDSSKFIFPTAQTLTDFRYCLAVDELIGSLDHGWPSSVLRLSGRASFSFV